MRLTLCFTLLVCIFSLRASASSEMFYGSGNASGFCDGMFYQICSSNLKTTAEDAGKRDLMFRCELRGGKMASYQAFCNSSCNPSFLPSDAPQTFIACQANCNGPCELP